MSRAALFLFVFTFSLAEAATLQDLFQAALQSHPSIGISNTQEKIAEENANQAEDALFPRINAIGTYTRQEKVDRGGSNEQKQARINITQPLLRGLGEWAQMRVTDAREAQAREGQNVEKLSLFRRIGTNFYTALQLEKDLEHLNSQKALTEKRVSDLRARVSIGRSRKGEMLSAQASLASVAAQVEAALLEVRRAREMLSIDTQRPVTESLTDDSNQSISIGPTLETYLAKVDERPDIRQAKQSALAEEEAIGIARAGHFPSLDFAANYYLHREGALGDSKWDVGAMLTIPLFAGGTVQSQVRSAAENHKQAELRLASLRRDATLEITQLYQQLQSLSRQEAILRQAMQLAETNYQEQNRDYRYGLVTNLEVLQALDLFTDSKRAYDRAIYQKVSAHLNLEASVGKIR